MMNLNWEGVFFMQVHIHCQGFEQSRWMEQFILKKVCKLERYLNSSATVEVYLKSDGKCFHATLSIQTRSRGFAFTSTGYNLYEAYSFAHDKAVRELTEYKRKLKDKIHRRFTSKDVA